MRQRQIATKVPMFYPAISQCPPPTVRVSAAIRRITVRWNILQNGSFQLFRTSHSFDTAAECLLNPLHALSQAVLTHGKPVWHVLLIIPILQMKLLRLRESL